MTAPTIDVLAAELAQARQEISVLRATNRDLHKQVTHDELTGVLNRRGLAEAWTWQIDATDALALIDLDGFKSINDTYGHAAGDQVIAHVARILDSRYRIVARLGGDELVVVDNLHRLVDLEASWLVSVADGTTLAITGSTGITRAVPSRRLALARADAAMYRAKADPVGTDRVAWWSRDLDPHLRREEQLVDRPAVRLRDTRSAA